MSLHGLSVRLVYVLAVLFLTAPVVSAEALRTTAKPPAGFELYDAPQSSLVDLYFDAARIGRVMVTFTPTNVQFQTPDTVFGMLGKILNPLVVQRALTQNFVTNEALACTPQRRPPICGNLSPVDVGVIFDAANLRLDVFLNPNFRAVAGGGTDFLNPGERLPSALLSYGGATSIGLPHAAASQNYAGFVQADAAVGNYHYSSRILSQTANGFALDTADVAMDVRDWTYIAGLFEDDAIIPLVAGRLFGASAETSFHLRAKPDSLYGTPVVIFMPRRAQVDVYRGTRLLSSTHMEAGNQTLDTSQLPEGAYDLTIRITDSTGTAQDQHRYFIKSRDFAPDGQPYFHFDLGMREPYDAASASLIKGPFVAHAATKIRTEDWLSLNLDMFYFGKILFAGPGAVAIFDNLRFGLHGIESTRHDHAATVYTTAQFDPFFFRADFTTLISGVKPTVLTLTHPLDPVGIGFYQGTVSIDYTKTALSMGISAGYRRQLGVSQPTISPYIRLPLIREGPYNVTLGIEATRSGRQNSILVHLVAFQTTTATGFAKSTDLGYRTGSQRGTPDVSVGLDWQDPTAIGYDLHMQARAQQAFDQSLISANSDYRGPEGRFEGNLQGAATKSGALSAVGGGQFFGNMTLDEAGIEFGGGETQSSAIIVVINGGPPGVRFSVLIDGNPTGYAVAGEATPVPLSPYRRYQISIRPPIDQLLAINLRAEDVTLLPGMVKRLVWSVDAVKVVIARILDLSGQSLEHVRLDGASGPAVTGDNGWVQMEVRDKAEIYALDPSGARICRITLPNLNVETLVVSAGNLSCL
jgi:hypothetical protein